MRTPLAGLAAMPMLARAVLIGAASAGIAGSIAGLIVGLHTYAPTAPFAAVELGLPATIAGAVTGLTIGSIILIRQRIMRWHGP